MRMPAIRRKAIDVHRRFCCPVPLTTPAPVHAWRSCGRRQITDQEGRRRIPALRSVNSRRPTSPRAAYYHDNFYLFEMSNSHSSYRKPNPNLLVGSDRALSLRRRPRKVRQPLAAYNLAKLRGRRVPSRIPFRRSPTQYNCSGL